MNTPNYNSRIPADLTRMRRDELLRKVWCIMNELSNYEEMSQEDLDVWDKVTKHSAIQNRLDNAFNT